MISVPMPSHALPARIVPSRSGRCVVRRAPKATKVAGVRVFLRVALGCGACQGRVRAFSSASIARTGNTAWTYYSSQWFADSVFQGSVCSDSGRGGFPKVCCLKHPPKARMLNMINFSHEPFNRIIFRGCAHGRAAHAEARGEQFLSMLRPLNSLKISKR